MKFERLKGGIFERNMEVRTGGWKERQKHSKGCSTSEISKAGKKKNSWKFGKKQRNIGWGNTDGQISGNEKEAFHSKISCQVDEV